MPSRHAEFIATRGRTSMWANFEAAIAECAMEQEAIKAAQKEQKRQKAVKKRESHRCKKEKTTHPSEEGSAEIQARWASTEKSRKENNDIWLACPDASTCQGRGGSYRDTDESCAEIQAQCSATEKAGKENDYDFPPCEN